MADRRARPRARRPAPPGRRPRLSDQTSEQLIAEAHRLDAEAVQAGENGEEGRKLRAQAAALRTQAVGEKVYPVLTCAECFRLTGWVSANGNCDECVRRAQWEAVFSDPYGGWVSAIVTRQGQARTPALPLRARLAAGVSSRARARAVVAHWLAFVEPGDTGPIDPEPGYELEIALREEVELTDGSGILVRFSSVSHRFAESGWQQIETTTIGTKSGRPQIERPTIAHRLHDVPAEFPAALPIHHLVEAWGDYQAAIAAFNRRVWTREEQRREADRQSREAEREAREAREEALRKQRHTADLLREDR